MPAKVADASVLGALIFKEPKAPEAHRLLKGVELYEPAILAYELASVARKKVLKYPSERALIIQALQIALQMDIRWVEVDHLATVSLALEKNITTYDASYLLVSQLCQIPLVSFDARLKTAASY